MITKFLIRLEKTKTKKKDEWKRVGNVHRMTSESWRSRGDSARWGRDSARWSYSSAQGQRFVCRAGEHSWMLRAEVSFSDGNEIKNGNKREAG